MALELCPVDDMREDAVDGIVATFRRIITEGREGPSDAEEQFLRSCTLAEHVAAQQVIAAVESGLFLLAHGISWP
jgi:hypothetical protein